MGRVIAVPVPGRRVLNLPRAVALRGLTEALDEGTEKLKINSVDCNVRWRLLREKQRLKIPQEAYFASEEVEALPAESVHLKWKSTARRPFSVASLSSPRSLAYSIR